jgi:hypothetical protein
MFGLITFDHSFRVRVPLQLVTSDTHKASVRHQVDQARWGTWGGTNMYTSLSYALDLLDVMNNDVETWVVCLTDGESFDHSSIIESRLQNSSDKLHVILIGVNLRESLHAPMKALCNKYRLSDVKKKGFFIPTTADLDAINAAFQKVANCIPVSKTFELDGKLTNQDCWRLMKKYIPHSVAENDMLLQSFWIKYLYRRVKVFDENSDFNYNVKHESLGSHLMETMLSEVEQYLRKDQIKSWSGKNHHQLIYDFTDQSSPQFRLICTAPDEMDSETRRKYESLDLPGFFIPTLDDLEKRSTLDRYLSQALIVPLSTKDDDGEQRISCIDDHSFVLTLDFTMKLLSIHERVACCIPCIIEGETGVSKTALTKMYSILLNSRQLSDAKKATENDLKDIEDSLRRAGYTFETHESKMTSNTRIQRIVEAIPECDFFNDKTTAAHCLYELLQNACNKRSCMFQKPPSKFSTCAKLSPEILSPYLAWFSESFIEPLFFEINVHSSLSESDILHYFQEIQATSKKIKESQATVVVFLDGTSQFSKFYTL